MSHRGGARSGCGAAPDLATDLLFIVAGRSGVGSGILVALGFVAGAVTAPVVAAVRSLWSRSLTDETTRQTGFALISMLQETSFIAGPLLAGLLIGAWSATAAVAGAAVCGQLVEHSGTRAPLIAACAATSAAALAALRLRSAAPPAPTP